MEILKKYWHCRHRAQLNNTGIPIPIQYTHQKQQFQYNSKTNSIPHISSIFLYTYWLIELKCVDERTNCFAFCIVAWKRVNLFVKLVFIAWNHSTFCSFPWKSHNWDCFALVLGLLTFENSTNTNTILTSRIVHLWHRALGSYFENHCFRKHQVEKWEHLECWRLNWWRRC